MTTVACRDTVSDFLALSADPGRWHVDLQIGVWQALAGGGVNNRVVTERAVHFHVKRVLACRQADLLQVVWVNDVPLVGGLVLQGQGLVEVRGLERLFSVVVLLVVVTVLEYADVGGATVGGDRSVGRGGRSERCYGRSERSDECTSKNCCAET